MKKYLSLLALAVAATACAPVYIPNARNSPLFRGAGEVQATIHISQGFDFQGAVAVTDNIGVMANYNMINKTTTSNEGDYIQHHFFEGAIGYYENSDRLSYEIYGGYGKGKGTSFDDYDFFSNASSVKATGEYHRFFIQPGLGSNRKTFNWIVSARFSWVDFTNFESDGQRVRLDAAPVLFIEPAFTGRVNFRKSKLFMAFQGGLSYAQSDPYFEYEPFFVSIAMGLRLGGNKTKAQE
jgi:hypothetical protein